ncbi:MAG: hypothetical protein ACOX8H_12865 [Ruminococcus sp.]
MMKEKNRKNTMILLAAATALAVLYIIMTFAGKGGKNIEGTWQSPEEMWGGVPSLTLYETGYGEANRIGGLSDENVSWTYEGDVLTLVPEDLLQNETCSYRVRWEDGDMVLLSDSFTYTLEKVS